MERVLDFLPSPGSPWRESPPPQFPMPWASHWGEDAFGLWCGFTINGVMQKMRWIAPGEFIMGSPLGEVDRRDDERQHRVQLSQGYWMADTACSQALWQAVMPNNPSRFKEHGLPVERVSWDEV